MKQQAEDGHEIETELKLVISEEQYDKLVRFISGVSKGLTIAGQRFSIDDFQTKVRRYRDFDTQALDLLDNSSSLTARDRGETYAVTAKFPTKELGARDEYTESVSAEVGSFDAFDFLSLPLEPVEQAKRVSKACLQEILQRTVTTHRANLWCGGTRVAELAVDRVAVSVAGGWKEVAFWELEIERTSQDCDIHSIREALQLEFGKTSEAGYASKYERAMQLARP